MDARMVMLAAAGSGLLLGLAAGASPPAMKPAPEQPWERLLRPDPPPDPYAVAYASLPQDTNAPNWLEPRVPVYAWEIDQYARSFTQSFYDEPALGEYRPEAYPPLPGLEEARAEIVALAEATREAHDAAAAAAATAASVEAMARREHPDEPPAAAALAAEDAQST